MPTIQGREVPAELLGRLQPADPDGDLAAQLAETGYLYLPGVLDAEAVLTARAEVLGRLEAMGEIRAPATAGIVTGQSRRAELSADLGRFWREVSEGPALRRLTHGPAMRALMERLFDEPVAAFDFLWLRVMAPGKASPLHMDHPYMNRGTDRLVTAWTPLGSVGLDEGPLFMVEGSHRWADMAARFRGLDVDRTPDAKGFAAEDPIELAASRGARLLTTAWRPGDIMVFGMFTLHAAFDNGASGGKVRVSCDCRWQPAKEPMDERFRGPDPPAHGGKGYGCLMAARPLGEGLALR
jgi:hypothetical protein